MADNNELDPEVMISPADLDAADYGVPKEFALEVAAGAMKDQLANLTATRAALTAARHNENPQRAEALARDVMMQKVTIAVLQRDHPGAKTICDELMRYISRQARQNRLKALSEE